MHVIFITESPKKQKLSHKIWTLSYCDGVHRPQKNKTTIHLEGLKNENVNQR